MQNTVQKQKEWKNETFSENIDWKKPNSDPTCPQIPAVFLKKKPIV